MVKTTIINFRITENFLQIFLLAGSSTSPDSMYIAILQDIIIIFNSYAYPYFYTFWWFLLLPALSWPKIIFPATEELPLVLILVKICWPQLSKFLFICVTGTIMDLRYFHALIFRTSEYVTVCYPSWQKEFHRYD